MGPAPQCHDISQTRGKMRSKTHHLWTVKACVCVLWGHECVRVGSLGGPSTSLCGLESMSVQPCRVSLPITPLHPGEHQPNGWLSRKILFYLSTIYMYLYHTSLAVLATICKANPHANLSIRKGGFWCVSGESRGAGGALREANIFSGFGRHCKNTLLMLMCIRSEPGKY